MQDSLEDYLQFTRNSNPDDSLKFSKEFVVTAQVKKDCDARAMKIVEFSIEGKLRPEVFTKCLPFINQSHYQDIVEERALTRLCGYSLCGKRIPEMPKKQYFISTKSNKVYDITDRKNFCSNFCYKASLHIKKQIDNSPLWLRKLEDIPEYKLLNTFEGGLPGEFVDPGVVKPVKDEPSFSSIKDFARASLDDINEKQPGGNRPREKTRDFKKSPRLKSTMQTINETEVEEESIAVSENETIKITKKSIKVSKKEIHKRCCFVSLPSIEENEEKQQNSKENDCVKETNVIINVDQKIERHEEVKQEIKTTKPTQDQSQVLTENTALRNTYVAKSIKEKTLKKVELLSIIPNMPTEATNTEQFKSKSISTDLENVVKKAIQGWLTLETCIFVHGEEKVKQILDEKKLSDYFDKLQVQQLKIEQQKRYMDICRRLQLQEMADEKFDKVATGNATLKPLPDYKTLKEETKDLKVKVKAFFEGTMYNPEDKSVPTKINRIDGTPEDDLPLVMPAVDTSSKKLLRRKIFLNSSSKAIQQVLQALGFSYSVVSADIQALVKTFSLRADNITFKPSVWKIIALVLVKLLSLKDEGLKELLNEPRSQEYIRVLVDSFSNKETFLSDVLCNVTDLDLFIEGFISNDM